MILAAVDDFLFRSKIRTTAKQAGVDISFVKTSAELLDQARSLKPSLVIFDLNSSTLQPVETIAAMKRDASLASIRTLGFVSHVDAARIHAARAAGADDVMARSTFAGQLGEILTSAGNQP